MHSGLDVSVYNYITAGMTNEIPPSHISVYAQYILNVLNTFDLSEVQMLGVRYNHNLKKEIKGVQRLAFVT